MDIKDYIGNIYVYYTKEQSSIGTAFFIDGETIVTAAHVIRYNKNIEKFIIEYKNEKYNIENKDTKIVDEFAIIRCNDLVKVLPDIPLSRFNISFQIDSFKNIDWEAFGFKSMGAGGLFCHLSGSGCDKNYCKYDYKLTNLNICETTYSGMSGSPVMINGMIVGILQAEDKINNISSNLYLSSIQKIIEYIPELSITKNVYNNYSYEKICYKEKFIINNYINRKISHINSKTGENEEKYLIEYIEESKNSLNFIVLLGEAGTGKTYELQKLAIDLSGSDFLHYPVYKNLKQLRSGQSLEEYVSQFFDYLNNGVPVCLILDGYDELTGMELRDNDFPKLINQLTEKICESYQNQKVTIVISSRKNFYEFKRFPNYKVLNISKLHGEDIEKVLEVSGIEVSLFNAQIKERKLESFISNPFYLKYLIELFEKDSKLPSSNDLMDQIIKHLFAEKNYKKYTSTEQFTKANVNARKNLQKIAASFLLNGCTELTDDEYYELIDGQIDKEKNNLIKCSGILECEDSNYFFIHNNYKEYLAAEFFNNKYPDSIESILQYISYKDKSGIKKSYLNMVSFLVLIRENDDLVNWIIETSPGSFSSFETEKLTEEKRYLILKNIFTEAINKREFLIYDVYSNIYELVNNGKCVNYLLDTIDKTDNEIVLLNAFRILQRANVPNACLANVKEIICRFIDSGKGTENNIRDAINVFTELGINSRDVTELLYRKYYKIENHQIRVGLYRYIEINNLSDKFFELLVTGLKLSPKGEYTSISLIEGLKSFHEKHSFIAFFHNIIDFSDGITRGLQRVFSDDVFINNLIITFNVDKDESFLIEILDISAFLVHKLYFNKNIFEKFFKDTGTERYAIEYFYNKFNNNAVCFEKLTHNFKDYCYFLMDKYRKCEFDNQSLTLFNYCVRAFAPDSRQRLQFMSLIKECRYPSAENSIEYITYSDNYYIKEKENKKFYVKCTLNFKYFKGEMIKLIETLGLKSPNLNELWEKTHKKYRFDDFQCVLTELLSENMGFSENVQETMQYIESNESNLDFWTINCFCGFISGNNDYTDYFSHQEIENILNLCKKHINNYSPTECIIYNCDGCSIKDIRIKSALTIVAKLNLPLDEETLCKLLYVPPEFFDGHHEKGFSEYLVNNLSCEKILDKIYYYIDNNFVNGFFIDICLKYCISQNVKSNKIVELAKKSLVKESSSTDYYCCKYLIDNNKQDIIVSLIREEKISDFMIVKNIALLSDYYSQDLLLYVSDLFDALYKCYKNYDENEVIERFSFVEKIYSSGIIKDKLIECLNRLLNYLVKNDSEKHINVYLDSMIEEKGMSPLEANTFETLISSIKSIKYIDKLIVLFELIYSKQFKKADCTNIASELEQTIIYIGHKYPDEVKSKLSVFLSSENDSLKRMTNIIIDTLMKYTNEKATQKYTIEQIRKIVF